MKRYFILTTIFTAVVAIAASCQKENNPSQEPSQEPKVLTVTNPVFTTASSDVKAYLDEPNDGKRAVKWNGNEFFGITITDGIAKSWINMQAKASAESAGKASVTFSADTTLQNATAPFDVYCVLPYKPDNVWQGENEDPTKYTVRILPKQTSNADVSCIENGLLCMYTHKSGVTDFDAPVDLPPFQILPSYGRLTVLNTGKLENGEALKFLSMKASDYYLCGERYFDFDDTPVNGVLPLRYRAGRDLDSTGFNVNNSTAWFAVSPIKKDGAVAGTLNTPGTAHSSTLNSGTCTIEFVTVDNAGNVYKKYSVQRYLSSSSLTFNQGSVTNLSADLTTALNELTISTGTIHNWGTKKTLNVGEGGTFAGDIEWKIIYDGGTAVTLNNNLALTLPKNSVICITSKEGNLKSMTFKRKNKTGGLKLFIGGAVDGQGNITGSSKNVQLFTHQKDASEADVKYEATVNNIDTDHVFVQSVNNVAFNLPEVIVKYLPKAE